MVSPSFSKLNGMIPSVLISTCQNIFDKATELKEEAAARKHAREEAIAKKKAEEEAASKKVPYTLLFFALK